MLTYISNLLYLFKLTWIKDKNVFSKILKHTFLASIPLVDIIGLGTIVKAIVERGNVFFLIVCFAVLNLTIAFITEIITYWNNISRLFFLLKIECFL